MRSSERAAATVTFLFTDIEGSTRRWEESPAMFDLVERHFAILRSEVDGAGGEVFTTLGDGVAAAFDSAEAAVGAAVAAQRQLRELGLDVRMGVHTGEAERVGGDYHGRPVNRAARIMAVGHGGQILLSGVTASLVRNGARALELVDLGVHRLRDLTEPERLWQVTAPGLPDRFPGVRGIQTGATNLPGQRSPLVGRDVEVRHLASTVLDQRLVTVTGVGGVGKTRLAVHTAAELTPRFDRVWFVPLTGVSDPDDVADAIAVAVGATVVTDPLVATLTALGDRRTLLVVDNCEHVVDRAASVIDQLTERCTNLSVLATSREPLGIAGEHVIAVGPLDPATTALELFHQRAAAAGADLGAVPRASLEALCARIDGLPLAIELAAARTAALGVDAILDALDDRIDVLTSGRRRDDGRHGTMHATVDWSFRLLEPDERRLFSWLSVFPGGFELDAACHVASALGIPHGDARDSVESLVHKSMISVDAGADGLRYRMLETIRAFALEQLDDRGERGAARSAMARWIATVAGAHVDDPCSTAVERSALRLEREADNWREAVLHATAMRSGELAAGMCGPPAAFFLLGRGDLSDLVRPLLEVCEDDLQRQMVLSAMVVSASGGTDPVQLQAWAAEVQAIDDRKPTGLGGLMRWLAMVWQGRFAASIEICIEASLDERVPRASRDLFVGIAILDHFSLTEATDDRHGLVLRALEVAERSDVALTRVACRLGVAWALVHSDASRCVALVQQAMADIPSLPALTRVTMPGSASRLLSRLEPTVAAAALLDQLEVAGEPSSFVDLIPLIYGAELLDGLGHTFERPGEPERIAPPVSMMDFVDRARRASDSGARDIDELQTVVREGLADLAGGGLDLAPVGR